jgi:hypothetical protein
MSCSPKMKLQMNAVGKLKLCSTDKVPFGFHNTEKFCVVHHIDGKEILLNMVSHLYTIERT